MTTDQPAVYTHTGMEAHDGYAAHSHEVRPDHRGVQREVQSGQQAEAGQAMTYVWLTCRDRDDVLGLFSSPERAKRVCQDSANEYFGPGRTPALQWQGDDTYCSASYHHPGTGMQVFTINMYELDKVQS